MDADTTKGEGLAASRHATPELEAPLASASANAPAPVELQNALKGKGNGLQLSKHASPSPEPEPPASKDTPPNPPIQKRGRGNAKYIQNAGTTKLERDFKFEALPDNQVKVDRFLEAVKEHFPYPSRRGGRGGAGGRGHGGPGGPGGRGGFSNPDPEWKGACGSESIPEDSPYRPTIRYTAQDIEKARQNATTTNSMPTDSNVPTFGTLGSGKVGYCACGMKFFLGKVNEYFVQGHLDRCAESNGCLSPVYPAPGKKFGKTAQKAIDNVNLDNAKASEQHSPATRGGRGGGRGGYGKKGNREGAPSPPDHGVPGGGVNLTASTTGPTAPQPSDDIKLSAAQLQGIIGAAVSSALEASKPNQQQVPEAARPDPRVGPYARTPFSVGPNGPFVNPLAAHFPGFDAPSPYGARHGLPENQYGLPGGTNPYSFYGIPPTQPQAKLTNDNVPQMATPYYGSRTSRNPMYPQGMAPPPRQFSYAGVPKGPKSTQQAQKIYANLKWQKPQNPDPAKPLHEDMGRLSVQSPPAPDSKPKTIDRSPNSQPEKQLDPKAAMFSPAVGAFRAAQTTVTSAKELPKEVDKTDVKPFEGLSNANSLPDLLARMAAQKAKREADQQAKAWDSEREETAAQYAVTAAAAGPDMGQGKASIAQTAHGAVDDPTQKRKEGKADEQARNEQATARAKDAMAAAMTQIYFKKAMTPARDVSEITKRATDTTDRKEEKLEHESKLAESEDLIAVDDKPE